MEAEFTSSTVFLWMLVFVVSSFYTQDVYFLLIREVIRRCSLLFSMLALAFQSGWGHRPSGIAAMLKQKNRLKRERFYLPSPADRSQFFPSFLLCSPGESGFLGLSEKRMVAFQTLNISHPDAHCLLNLFVSLASRSPNVWWFTGKRDVYLMALEIIFFTLDYRHVKKWILINKIH